MIQVNTSVDRTDVRGSFVIAAPHDYDATGSALRAAFEQGRQLPHDMQYALDRLDRSGDRR